MGKKMPIYLTTLTILASTLSLAPVGAVSETGPWSFDELTAAKDEVDAEASARCADSFTRTTCINSIMEEKGGIYYTGLWKFRYNQFTPLSMNFATGELGYYYNSTNEYRKNNNKRPYLKDYLTKLFIVQVEQGYDNWAADLRAGVKDSEHWQVLYDGSTTEEGDSLLPYDQKSSLIIGKPSFDSKYEKYLRVLYMGTFNTEAEINTYDFTECAEGRTCEAWYDTTNPFLYFKDFSFTDGYNDGYSSGFNDGQTIGHSNGYNGGYDVGYGDGYNNGYSDGNADGRDESYHAGYTEGLNNGLSEGYDDGYTAGHKEGIDEGYQNGQSEGYQDGYYAGYEAGRNAGYEFGFTDGYEDGYSNGYEAGSSFSTSGQEIDDYTSSNSSDDQPREGIATDGQNDSNDTNNKDNIDEINGVDGSTIKNDITNPDINTLTSNDALSSNNGISSTNVLALSSGQIASKSPLSSPDTGMPTAEKGTTEFPWWLGVISLTSVGVFVWFFGPKRKNHKKNIKNVKKV